MPVCLEDPHYCQKFVRSPYRHECGLTSLCTLIRCVTSKHDFGTLMRFSNPGRAQRDIHPDDLCPSERRNLPITPSRPSIPPHSIHVNSPTAWKSLFPVPHVSYFQCVIKVALSGHWLQHPPSRLTLPTPATFLLTPCNMSEKALQDAQLDRVKDISLTIRQAIRNSLPGAPDQFLTLMVPGKVLNFKVSRVRKSNI